MSEFMRLIGFKHCHADPSFFRRLRGPGTKYKHPTHTDSEVFRRSAPNQDFAAPHVETLAPDFTSALPEPNVYGTEQPEYTVPMGPLSLDELRLLKMADSTAAALMYLKKLAHDSKACDAKFWHELALWYVDDVAIGTFDRDEIIGELTRRFERITLHVNGGMFLGFDIVYDKEGKRCKCC